MKRIDLIPVEHSIQVGDVCGDIQPNITEDSIFYADGEPIGFYLRQLPDKMIKLSDLANAEFNSENVPKTILNRATAVKTMFKTEWKGGGTESGAGVKQMSCILGSIPPKPMVRRIYPTISSVHQHKGAQTFIKAMMLLAKESENLMRDIIPNQYEIQKQAMSQVPAKWRFTDMFTSSISNYNIAASYHRDTANLVGANNIIITKRLNSTGGNLNVPDYGATMDSANNSILCYPAWRNVHGVTPIVSTFEGGYRNSLIFYSLRAFVNMAQ